jgi:hypothetical protein
MLQVLKTIQVRVTVCRSKSNSDRLNLEVEHNEGPLDKY